MTYYPRRNRKAPPPLWLFVAIPVGLFGVLWLLSLTNKEFQANSRRLDQTAKNSAKVGTETAFAESERLLANSRFQSPAGCVHVPLGVGGVQEGAGFNWPSGTPVCDEGGTTGVLDENRRVADVARTGDTNVIIEWAGWQQ